MEKLKQQSKRYLQITVKRFDSIFNFKGSLSGREFLVNLYFIFGAAFIGLLFGASSTYAAFMFTATFVALTASSLRRLTDIGLSRWLSLVFLLPFIGWILLAVLLGLPSNMKSIEGLRAKFPKISIVALSFFTIFLTLSSPLVAVGTSNPSNSISNEVIATSSPTSSPKKSPTPSPTPTPTSSPTPTKLELSSSFAELISSLAIAEEQSGGYDRDLFQHWVDLDGDGCDTRKEVLIEESITAVTVGARCTLSGGTWVSAYDLVQSSDASSFDIDHFVPLKEAWESGAHAWDANTRKLFANDMAYAGSLIAVTASSNRSKSDRDPAGWMPTNSDYRCEYIYTWLQVKKRWGLTVDPVEKSSLETNSLGCEVSNLKLKVDASQATITLQPAPAPPVENQPAPAPEAPAAPALDPRFGTCGEANANGYGDYVSGVDEEYGWYRDRDKDGIVCER
jgi:uncharacterized membrane protein YhaH (DUF805 family)